MNEMKSRAMDLKFPELLRYPPLILALILLN